jgi:type IV secretory pathway VirB10-like protein
METGDRQAEAREGELELTPRPRIKKLSSAIVWIVAIFAVAVLWLVGYLVTTKSRRPQQERRVAAVPPPVEDLAERIKRAADREAQLRAERAAEERAHELPPPQELPPGFEELLAERPARSRYGHDPMAGDPMLAAGRERDVAGYDRSAPADSGRSALDRARDSELVPDAFRAATPRQAGGGRRTGDDTMPSPPDLASLRAELLQAAQSPQAKTSGEPAPAAAAAPEVGSLRPAGSPYRVAEGTLIPAVLTAAINSDLPGQTTALVRRNVYDSRTGRFLLIPQGSRLVGEYDSRVAFGQKRVLVAWNRLIFPDGRSLDLAGMPGVDLAAAAGLRDRVDNHFVRTFGSALLLAAVSAGVQLSQPDDRSFGTNPSASQVAAAAVGQELGRVATEYLRRNLDVRPTIEVRPGYELNVEVTADLDLEGPYDQAGATF